MAARATPISSSICCSRARRTIPVGEFSRRIAEVGGRENAFTSYDYTGYFQQVAPDQLAAMMHFEADRMVNLVLTDDVVLPELEVVIEERVSARRQQSGRAAGRGDQRHAL
jgi:zinc protease